MKIWSLEYYGQSRSIPLLLMPWRRKEPGHQQSWHWLCRINRSLSSTGKDFNYLHHLNAEKWQKKQIYFYVSWKKKISTIRVNNYSHGTWIFSHLTMGFQEHFFVAHRFDLVPFWFDQIGYQPSFGTQDGGLWGPDNVYMPVGRRWLESWLCDLKLGAKKR